MTDDQPRAASRHLNAEVGPWEGDLLLPGIFLAGAALVLGFIDPLYFGYEPRFWLTLLLGAVGALWLMWSAYRRSLRAYLISAAALLALVAACVATQPSPLGMQASSVMPARVALVAMVAAAWGFLMRPPDWARRALVAVGLPVAAFAVLTAWPAINAQSQGLALAGSNFSPYWIAVDTRGVLYATNADGNSIYVFDEGGEPLGAIWPAKQTRGEPGVLSLSLPTPVVWHPALPGSPQALVTPGPSAIPAANFCGVATDSRDNLYVVDNTGGELVKLDRRGAAVMRVRMPQLFDGSKGCIAVDDDYIYVSSRFGSVYILSHAGEVVREVEVSYQPFGISAPGDGRVVVMGPFQADSIDGDTGESTAFALPPPERQLRIPYQAVLALRNGDVLATDTGVNQVVRFRRDGQVAETLGDSGWMPGQFQAMGGLALDRQGHVYVADWLLGVVQRFGPGGKLDKVYWAWGPRPVQPVTEEEE